MEVGRPRSLRRRARGFEQAGPGPDAVILPARPCAWLLAVLVGGGCFSDPPAGTDPTADTGTHEGSSTGPSTETETSADDTHDTSGSVGGSGTETSEGGPSLDPVELVVDPEGGGVLAPNQPIEIRSSWIAVAGDSAPVEGSLESFTGPDGADYTIADGLATLDFDGGDVASCAFSGPPADCYAVVVTTSDRPEVHWDANLVERLDTGAEHDWILHVGDSFSDVLSTSRYYEAIETVLHHGITAGCTMGEFCPDASMSRAVAATFVVRALLAPDATPTTGTVDGRGSYDCSMGGTSLFEDVEPTNPHCADIHHAVANGIASGCESEPMPQFCAAQDIARWQVAVFAANGVAPGGVVPPDFADPTTGRSYDCSAVSPQLQFYDVDEEHLGCAHVHYLWALGAEIECATPTTFCPADGATRAQAAQFVADAFDLSLYGP